MGEFRGRCYVVTGAASGIGHAVAEKLAAEGAEVISLDRNLPRAAVSRHIEVDLADRVSIDTAIEQLPPSFDGLICVAGLPGTAPGEQVVAVNALAVRHLVESLRNRLTAHGSITVVSSTAGFGWPDRLPAIRDLLATKTFDEGAAWFKAHPQEGNAYMFSKEVATVYTMSMSLALAAAGSRINAVLPGPVQTLILADFEKSMGKQVLDGAKELLGRHAEAGEIADAVVFLASDAARWINGHALVVDGGLTGAVLTGVVPVPQI